MKMVASSKLHRAQQAIGNMRPYEKHLFEIMSGFLSKLEDDIETRYSETREVRKVAIVAISSNSSLCGAFNTNVIKELKNTAAEYRAKGCEVEVYPIGRKVADAARKMGFKFESDHSALLEHPEYGSATILSEKLMTRFSIGEIDKVILIYQHFASTSRQEMRAETFLPINLQEIGTDNKAAERKGKQLDFIIEPSVQSIVESLIPTSLHFKIFTARQPCRRTLCTRYGNAGCNRQCRRAYRTTYACIQQGTPASYNFGTVRHNGRLDAIAKNKEYNNHKTV